MTSTGREQDHPRERHRMVVQVIAPVGWSDSGNGPDTQFAADAVLEALTDAFHAPRGVDGYRWGVAVTVEPEVETP